ncbi:hypothetical protein M514_06354 [Trichuris suis]|uniref:Uncharacterized protein n=1 Tax=Trichuris suis TaxID=68888 RepID=A0A085NPT8_9BILA|nr:hypothetical protein M514_06354 [Trichuris suis]
MGIDIRPSFTVHRRQRAHDIDNGIWSMVDGDNLFTIRNCQCYRKCLAVGKAMSTSCSSNSLLQCTLKRRLENLSKFVGNCRLKYTGELCISISTKMKEVNNQQEL